MKGRTKKRVSTENILIGKALKIRKIGLIYQFNFKEEISLFNKLKFFYNLTIIDISIR